MRILGLAAALAAGVIATGSARAETSAPEPSPESVPAVEPRAGIYLSEAGRYEIVTLDPLTGRAAVELAEAVWRHLRGPLTLPDRFTSVITVRFLPEDRWSDAAPFRTLVEAGGLVSLWVRWTPDLKADTVRQALVQALLTRLAVYYHGWSEATTVPVWLERACDRWVETREQPAMYDAWMQEAAGLPAPALDSLLGWKRSDGDAPALRAGSFALMQWLYAEGGRNQKWGAWVRGLLGGGDAATGLAGVFGGRDWSDAAERELVWQVAYHQVRREKLIPLMTSGEARGWLADLYRIVLLDTRTGREAVLGLDELWANRKDRVVRAEVAARLRTLEGGLRSVHPFYQNAAASLGRLWLAVREENEEAFAAARTDFLADARAGQALEEATAAALDGLVGGAK